MSIDGTKPENLPLLGLISACQQETARFLEGKDHNTDSCYEIWRRAFQQRDQAAWEAFFSIYASRVRKNLQRQTHKWPPGTFDEEELVNGVFFRIFRSITPEKFGQFPTLPKLLTYLKMCCATEVVDIMRQKGTPGREITLDASVEDENSEASSGLEAFLYSEEDEVENKAQHQADRGSFWQLISRHLPTRTDQLAVYARFVMGMPPREIAALYFQYFEDVAAVNRTLKNAMWRLKQDPDLKNWFNDLSS